MNRPSLIPLVGRADLGRSTTMRYCAFFAAAMLLIGLTPLQSHPTAVHAQGGDSLAIPADQDFGTHEVGAPNPPRRTLTVRNNTGQSVTVRIRMYSHPAFQHELDRTVTLGPGETDSVQVTFAPVAVGRASHTVIFDSAALPGGSAVAALTGIGVGQPLSAISFDPVLIDFGYVPVGGAAMRSLTVMSGRPAGLARTGGRNLTPFSLAPDPPPEPTQRGAPVMNVNGTLGIAAFFNAQRAGRVSRTVRFVETGVGRQESQVELAGFGFFVTRGPSVQPRQLNLKRADRGGVRREFLALVNGSGELFVGTVAARLNPELFSVELSTEGIAVGSEPVKIVVEPESLLPLEVVFTGHLRGRHRGSLIFTGSGLPHDRVVVPVSASAN